MARTKLVCSGCNQRVARVVIPYWDEGLGYCPECCIAQAEIHDTLGDWPPSELTGFPGGRCQVPLEIVVGGYSAPLRHPREVEVFLTEEDLAAAAQLAGARLSESARRLSPDRPTSRTPIAQLRGACGEVGAARWLRDLGYEVVEGFFHDDRSKPDLTVGDVGLEVMTAQMKHRDITGFCVPPNKLWAARRRGVEAYVFVGTTRDPAVRSVWIQRICHVDDVDRGGEPRWTRVSPNSPSVKNYVVRDDDLLDPDEIGGFLDRGSTTPPHGGGRQQ